MKTAAPDSVACQQLVHCMLCLLRPVLPAHPPAWLWPVGSYFCLPFAGQLVAHVTGTGTGYETCLCGSVCVCVCGCLCLYLHDINGAHFVHFICVICQPKCVAFSSLIQRWSRPSENDVTPDEHDDNVGPVSDGLSGHFCGIGQNTEGEATGCFALLAAAAWESFVACFCFTLFCCSFWLYF